MKLNQAFFVLLSAVVLAACAKIQEQTPPETTGEEVSLRAGIRSIGTRTWLDAGSGAAVLPVYWSDGDRVNVNGQNSAPLSVKPGAKVSDAEFQLRSVSAPYSVIYPAEIVAGKTYSDGAINIVIPSTQDYVEGSFAPGAAILYGYAENAEGSVTMLNLCAAVRVRLWGNASIVIENASLNSAAAPVAGSFTLKPADGSLTAVEGSNDLALNLGEGVAVSSKGTWFYFTIPAGEYPDGITFTFTQKSDRRSMKCHWTPSGALKAGVLYSFSNVEFVPAAKDIETPDDWNEFALCVNEGGDMRKWLRDGVVHLGADISADALTQVEGAFVWEFDGQGHSITRTADSRSLFRSIRGTVKGLTLAGSVSSTDAIAGVLADTLYAGGSILDCSNAASLTVNSQTNAIAGSLAAVMTGGTVRGCSNSGALTANVDCSEGNLDDLILGGLIGKIDVSLEESSDAILQDCINTGELLADPTYTLTAQTYGIRHAGIGGIAGWLRGTGHSFSLNNCDNSGLITYGGSKVVSENGLAKFQVSAGGIVGIAADLNITYGVFPTTGVGTNGLDVSFEDCDNSGTVHNCGVNYSNKDELTTKVYTGGIVGSLFGTADKMASLVSCTNTGTLLPYDLTGDSASSRALYSQVVGGLIGYAGYVSMDKCTVNCTIGNGKRQMYSLAGAVGLVVRTFSLTNSTIWYTGYFNRYSNNNHTNSATVAVPPVKFGAAEVSPQPALGKFVISGCRLGAKLYYYNAPHLGKDDYSSLCTSSTMLRSTVGSAIRGWKLEFTEPYCAPDYVATGNTDLTSAP